MSEKGDDVRHQSGTNTFETFDKALVLNVGHHLHWYGYSRHHNALRHLLVPMLSFLIRRSCQLWTSFTPTPLLVPKQTVPRLLAVPTWPAGAWTLNGATVNIPYMPYSANASQILYITNAGDQAGDILATAFDDKGNSYDLGKIGVSNGKTVTKIAKQVGDALVAKGFTGGKVSITITVNAPADDITVYASYNVGGADRGFVNTDQYKGVK